MELPPIQIETGEDEAPGAVYDTRAVELTCPAIEGVVAASLMVGGEELGAPVRRLGDALWRWNWNPRGRAGVFMAILSVLDGDGRSFTRDYQLDVTPAYLKRDDYDALLRAIQHTSAALVYALEGGGMAADATLKQTGQGSLLEWYATRLRREARVVATVTEAIKRHHHFDAHQVTVEQELQALRELQPTMLARAAEQPLDEAPRVRAGPLRTLVSRGNGRLPRSLPVRAVRHTAEVYEHMVLVRVARDLRRRCQFVRAELRREITWREGSRDRHVRAVLNSLDAWDASLGKTLALPQRCLDAPVLAGVPPAQEWKGISGRMQRERPYRAVAGLWRRLHRRPFVAVHSPAFDLPVGDTPALYELWCLLEVAMILNDIGTPVEQILIRPSNHHEEWAGWKVAPAPNVPLVVRRLQDGTELRLFYQRRYEGGTGHTARLGSLDPFLRIPDIALEINPPDGCPSTLILDAKYRVTGAGTIPEDAIADAYTYRSAIGYRGRSATCGAYLLFPGAQGWENDGIGAIPTRPDDTHGLRRLLHTHVLDGQT